MLIGSSKSELRFAGSSPDIFCLYCITLFHMSSPLLLFFIFYGVLNLGMSLDESKKICGLFTGYSIGLRQFSTNAFILKRMSILLQICLSLVINENSESYHSFFFLSLFMSLSFYISRAKGRWMVSHRSHISSQWLRNFFHRCLLYQLFT